MAISWGLQPPISTPDFFFVPRPWSAGCPANAECLAEDQGMVPGAEPAGGRYQVGATGGFRRRTDGFLADLGTIGKLDGGDV